MHPYISANSWLPGEAGQRHRIEMEGCIGIGAAHVADGRIQRWASAHCRFGGGRGDYRTDADARLDELLDYVGSKDVRAVVAYVPFEYDGTRHLNRLGEHVRTRLEADGVDVFCVDDVAAYEVTPLRTDHIEHKTMIVHEQGCEVIYRNRQLKWLNVPARHVPFTSDNT